MELDKTMEIVFSAFFQIFKWYGHTSPKWGTHIKRSIGNPYTWQVTTRCHPEGRQ